VAAKVFLVRHADAGDREAWQDEDRLRPLSEKGWKQARRLGGLLADRRIDRIRSSPYLRCRQTVEPPAEIFGLQVLDEPLLAEGTHWRKALGLILATTDRCVMCSQGDVIAYLVMGYLVEEKGLIKPTDALWSKASTWELTVKDGDISAAKYIPPPKG
jgi:phosphohistidine phosphatase SixA